MVWGQAQKLAPLRTSSYSHAHKGAVYTFKGPFLPTLLHLVRNLGPVTLLSPWGEVCSGGEGGRALAAVADISSPRPLGGWPRLCFALRSCVRRRLV